MTETNIQDALHEVRVALLEADVALPVVRDFTAKVREQAMGREVLQSLTPGQTLIGVVHKELTALMGDEAAPLDFASQPPAVFLMAGLQGAGKTTTCGKLALKLRKDKRNPLLVPADIYRPAAIEQLKTLGRQINVPVYDTPPGQEPVRICEDARRFAELNGYDTLILDTAGRLHIDEELMDELVRIKSAVAPREILFVADAMTGQDAVNVARSFDEKLDLTGVILTKLDGDARGGAALSIRAVTGKPIKLVGLGEKLDALETFHPERMAQRILGMGDVLTLIEKAEATVSREEAAALEQRLRKEGFTLETFRDQLQSIKKMGSMESILKMIPGAGKALKQAKDMQLPDKELKKIEAIIGSMTPSERRNHRIINGSRRLRIAKGSGTSVQDVNQLLKRFTEAQKMMKKMQQMGPKGLRGLLGRGGGLPF